MTDISAAARPAAKAPRSGFLTWLKGRRVAARRARDLEALDDTMLRDIGLTRDSVRSVTRRGRWPAG